MMKWAMEFLHHKINTYGTESDLVHSTYNDLLI